MDVPMLDEKDWAEIGPLLNRAGDLTRAGHPQIKQQALESDS